MESDAFSGVVEAGAGASRWKNDWTDGYEGILYTLARFLMTNGWPLPDITQRVEEDDGDEGIED
jgi:hypothetical protein